MAVESGRDITIAVSPDGTNTTATGWVTVGQQRGGSTERSTETADATYKGSGGWASAAFTRQSWGLSFDGVLDDADAGWTRLYAVWEGQFTVAFKIDGSSLVTDTNITQSGQGWITSLSFEFPESDVVSYSCEVQGDGALADIAAP